MKIKIGLTASSSGWEQLLLQEGVPFGLIGKPSGSLREQFSVIVVNGILNGPEREVIEEFLRHGGAVIGSAMYMQGVGKTQYRKEKISYLLPEGANALPGFSLLDLDVNGVIPREANQVRTDQNTFCVFAGPLCGGLAIILPFDPGDAMGDARATNRNFHAMRDRLPSEHVSLVSKGEVRQLVHGGLEFLHHERGLPYVHLWYFPDGFENVFAFRLDTDASPRAWIDETYSVSRDYGIGFTWYLDVASHEGWVSHFGKLAGQEIGIHCYAHTVGKTREAIREDLTRALHVVREEGLKPHGIAAPYGIWTPALAGVVQDLGFFYSSEFSYAYDSLPLFPEADGRVFPTLQVPVHPVCIGSLARVGYSADQMRQYYRAVVQQKLLRHEPLFFYHHPAQRHAEVVRSLLDDVTSRAIPSMTLGEFAFWWIERLQTRFEANVDGKNLRLDAISDRGPSGTRGCLRISRPDGMEARVPITSTFSADAVTWRERKPFVVPPDIRRIREFDPRRVLGDLYTTMIRKLR
jgi:hypothetical protein